MVSKERLIERKNKKIISIKIGVRKIEKIILILVSVPMLVIYVIAAIVISFYFVDKRQSQHAILRTHPILGRLRYILEMLGPEMRQYWFMGDKENRPIDRDTQETIAKAGKYGSTVIGFGSRKDFSQGGYYLKNSMFPVNLNELEVDNTNELGTYKYTIQSETIASRKERRDFTHMKPWHLTKDNEIIIGEKRKHPFHLKGQVGISAMSYGALSKSAVKALAQGVAISGGSFMNTGEGGISPYHLSKTYSVISDGLQISMEDKLGRSVYKFVKKLPNASNFELEEKFGEKVYPKIQEMIKNNILVERGADLIFQVGSGLYGARKNEVYDEGTFLRNALKPEVKAIEIKLAQGAKVRGGKLLKEKITKEISEIRGVEMGVDIESPNRFPLFSNTEELFDLITNWQELTGKPVGIKVVAGGEDTFNEIAEYMKNSGKHPDFIAIDGAEGGTGTTTQEMADSLGLPIYSGIIILDKTLKRYGVRDDVKIIASGMLATSDKMAITLSLGADLIYVARAAMNTIGCINAMKCHTNLCPVGVTSHLPHLEAGLAVEEKRFRTANYLATMRSGLFELGASCGLSSPTGFVEKHITFQNNSSGSISRSGDFI